MNPKAKFQYRWTVLTAIVLILSAGCGSPSAKSKPSTDSSSRAESYCDRFAGDTLELELRLSVEDSQKLVGSITIDGDSFDAEATLADDQLTGFLVSEGSKHGFTATLDKDRLTLTSGGTTYNLNRKPKQTNPLVKQTPASFNPLEKTKREVGNRGKADSRPRGQSVSNWQTHTTASGLRFRYPKTWKVQTTNGGTAIVPADAEQDANGQPLEVVILGSEDASGIQSIDDPQVTQFLDGQIQQMFPSFRRDQQARSRQTQLGNGIVLQYQGKTPTGLEGKAVVYATLHQGRGIFLIHLGRHDLVENRQSESSRIFASFDWSQGESDQQLVGTWKRSESSSSSIDSRGYVGGTTTRTWVFAADGKVAYGTGTAIYGHSGSISIDPSQSRNVSQGTWAVIGNQLTIQWSDGTSSRFEYRVFPHVDNQTGLKLIAEGSSNKQYFIKQ